MLLHKVADRGWCFDRTVRDGNGCPSEFLFVGCCGPARECNFSLSGPWPWLDPPNKSTIGVLETARVRRSAQNHPLIPVSGSSPRREFQTFGVQLGSPWHLQPPAAMLPRQTDHEWNVGNLKVPQYSGEISLPLQTGTLWPFYGRKYASEHRPGRKLESREPWSRRNGFFR